LYGLVLEAEDETLEYCASDMLIAFSLNIALAKEY
jgi:hypothetical protein